MKFSFLIRTIPPAKLLSKNYINYKVQTADDEKKNANAICILLHQINGIMVWVWVCVSMTLELLELAKFVIFMSSFLITLFLIDFVFSSCWACAHS